MIFFKSMRHFFYCTRLFLFMVWILAAAALGTPAIADGQPRSLTRAEQRLVHAAQQAIAKKEYDQAQKMLSVHAKKHPEGVHYLVSFTMGNALAMDGHPRMALAHYKTSSDANPSYGLAWQNMGKVLFDLHQYSDAGDSLVRAHALEKPPTPSTAYQAAVAYILAEKPASAQPILENLLRTNEKEVKTEWLDALLKVYLDLGMRNSALHLTRDLLNKAGDKPHLWQILAHIYINAKEYHQAAAALEIYTTLTPLDADKISLLGDLYMIAGVPVKAAKKFETLLSRKPTASIYEKTASAYIAAHRNQKAVDVLKLGVKHHPTSKMWLALGSIHYEEARFEPAYQAFQKCTRLNPKNGGAALMMGYAAMQAHNLEAAKSAFSQASRHPQQRTEAKRMLKQVKLMQTELTQTLAAETAQ